MIEGHCTTLFLVTSKREAGFRRYPRQELAAYRDARSGRKIRVWILPVRMKGLKGGRIIQYHEILYCSRESRTGGRGGRRPGREGKA